MKGFRYLILLFLTGCAVGPDYETPTVVLPDEYQEPHQEANAGELKHWWHSFNDPVLDTFIQEALAANLDLSIALEKINEVRALYKIQAANLYPKVDFTAQEQRMRISQSLFDSRFLGPPLQNYYQIGFDASWEIDIFGKRRRAKEAAYYEYEAQIENTRDVYITLLGDIAATYIDICATQQKIILTERNISIQEELLALAESLYQSGLDSEIAPQTIRAKLEEISSTLPLLQTSLQQGIHRLAVLLGKNPEAVQERFKEKRTIPISTDSIPVGLPSDLLRRRPDIRQAERTLAAATANIGVAIADLFPSFSLLGAFGFESDHSNNWLKAISRSWTIGPAVNWPILYFGRIRNNIRVQNSKQEQALLAYEQTILTSLEDVENALIAYYKEEERVNRFQKQVEVADRIYQLTRYLYLSGLADFSKLLETDKERVLAQNNLTESTQQLSINRVALYKSLGGEW